MRKLSSLISVALLSFAFAAVGCATSEGTDDELADAQSDATSPGKVDLVQSSDSQWRFKVISGNGRTLLQSETYSTRTGAINGVFSALENGIDPAMYQLNQASNGGYNLRLAVNTKILASTQVYASKATATRAIGSCVRALETYLDKREANTTGARVEVFELTDSFVFHVYASNGAAILHSEKYSSAAAAWNGAFAVQEAAKLATGFTVGTTTSGQYFFTLHAANGEAVGNSELYSTRSAALAGIESVKASLANLDLI